MGIPTCVRPSASPSRWVSRSPRNAVAAVLVLISMIVAATWAFGALAPEPSAPAPRAATSAPADAASPVATALPPVPVPPAAVAAARIWAQALLARPGQTQQDWLGRLAPLTTPEFLGILADEAAADNAPRQITGPASEVGAAAGSAVVDVPTDLGALRIDLVAGDTDGVDTGAWLVSGADDHPATGGAG